MALLTALAAHASAMPAESAVLDYAKPFIEDEDTKEWFVEYLSLGDKKQLGARCLNRAEFMDLALKGVSVLVHQLRLSVGERCVHYFTDNRLEDLVFRLSSVFAGTVPVTINWQADSRESIAYKVEVTEAGGAIVDAGADRTALPAGLVTLDASAALADASQGSPRSSPKVSSDRIVIFTSGTTGKPKGVRLSYGAYVANRGTFEEFLAVGDNALECVVTNPFHHTNSTAITDWCLRRPGPTKLRLLQRYTTNYWTVVAAAGLDVPWAKADAETLAAAASTHAKSRRVVCPLVSRHIDFLDELCANSQLAVPLDVFRVAASRVSLLLGSAPVGPTTVARLEKWCGKLPVVRFGSTETCLQVSGTPLNLSEHDRLAAFKAGWSHEYPAGEPKKGYYIGTDHRPWTEVRVVVSVDRVSEFFLKDCDDGQPGYLITRGANLMTAYVANPEATARSFQDGWYLNLGDVGFKIGRHLYWQSRDSAMLIRGGANYAYEQINAELREFSATHFQLPDLDLAVVGIKIDSEHEDACCVTIDLPLEHPKIALLQQSFIPLAKKTVSKGAKPDKLRIGAIPKNFKGIVLIPELAKQWKAELKL